jgi:hypothetical protein
LRGLWPEGLFARSGSGAGLQPARAAARLSETRAAATRARAPRAERGVGACRSNIHVSAKKRARIGAMIFASYPCARRPPSQASAGRARAPHRRTSQSRSTRRAWPSAQAIRAMVTAESPSLLP